MALSEVAALLQALVRCDTTNPPGHETAAAQMLAAWLGERGVPAEMDEVAPGRANLIARVRFGEGPRLVLNTHMDVVPAGGGWASPPFAGEIVAGRLTGRGAADAKGSLAAMAAALALLRARGDRTRGEVILAAVTDEEGSSAGARHLLRDLRADAAIVGEPTALNLITCHKGSVRPVVEIRGRAAHAAQPAGGVNALYGAARLLLAIEEHAAALTANVHPLVGAPTIVPVMMSGGEALNMVPEHCRITFDRRLTPDEREEEVLARFADLLARFQRDHPELTVTLVELAPSTGGPSQTADDDPFVVCCRAALREIGQQPELGGMQVNCDMSHFRRAGMPTVVYGPGDPRAMHVVDEAIDLEQLDTATAGYLAMAVCYLDGGAA
ncbi:MAG: M20 family metallopeptidase [Thermomicrobiales bacterium]